MNKTQYTAELTLIYAIPDLIIGSLKGSLKGKYQKLQKLCKKELTEKGSTRTDFLVSQKAINKFFDEAKWIDKKRSIGTYLSFLLALMDESENTFPKKIYEILNDIVEFHERIKPFSTLCYSAGAVACGKWNRIKGELLG